MGKHVYQFRTIRSTGKQREFLLTCAPYCLKLIDMYTYLQTLRNVIVIYHFPYDVCQGWRKIILVGGIGQLFSESIYSLSCVDPLVKELLHLKYKHLLCFFLRIEALEEVYMSQVTVCIL